MKDNKLCITPFCKRKRRKYKKYCNTCDKKNWRQNNPMKACFQTLRQNARRRGKVFKLTFPYFEKFCYRTNYMAGKGRSKESYSIDCIKNELGYVEGNIQMMPKGENSRKKNKTLVYDWEHPEYTHVI